MCASKAFWWSPSGSKLAFTAIDETNVTKAKLFFFESPDTLGPRVVDHSYPMVSRILIKTRQNPCEFMSEKDFNFSK